MMHSTNKGCSLSLWFKRSLSPWVLEYYVRSKSYFLPKVVTHLSLIKTKSFSQHLLPFPHNCSMCKIRIQPLMHFPMLWWCYVHLLLNHFQLYYSNVCIKKLTIKNTILMCVYIINNGNANGCLKAIVSNPFKESFYGKNEKKNQLMFWQLFSFPLKVVSKLF